MTSCRCSFTSSQVWWIVSSGAPEALYGLEANWHGDPADSAVADRAFETLLAWQRVEAARGLTHRVFNYNYGDYGPHLLASVTAKTYATRTSFEVASEALQLFGGNGLTKEYQIEKIMRDARASRRGLPSPRRCAGA